MDDKRLEMIDLKVMLQGRGEWIARLQAENERLQADNERLVVERDRANDAALRWAGVLREIVDLAHKRAHRQIERLARDTLGGVERPE